MFTRFKKTATYFFPHTVAGFVGGLVFCFAFWYAFSFITTENIERRREMLRAEAMSTRMRVHNIKAIQSAMIGNDSLARMHEKKTDSFWILFQYHYHRWDSLNNKLNK